MFDDCKWADVVEEVLCDNDECIDIRVCLREGADGQCDESCYEPED